MPAAAGSAKKDSKAAKGKESKEGKPAAAATSAPAATPTASGSSLAQLPHPEAALCNATGALHHLSFLDQAKAELGQLGAAALLVPLLQASNVGVYQNAVGTLWNMGTEPGNGELLQLAGAPAFVQQPAQLMMRAGSSMRV